MRGSLASLSSVVFRLFRNQRLIVVLLLIAATLLVYAPRGPRRTAYQLTGLVLVALVLLAAMALRLAV